MHDGATIAGSVLEPELDAAGAALDGHRVDARHVERDAHATIVLVDDHRRGATVFSGVHMAADDLVDLERAFAEAEGTEDVSVHLAFKERLVASHDAEALARHFDFVRRARNDALRQILAKFFAWHGTTAVPFLEQVLENEADPVARATALQMLGAIGGRHSEAKPAAEAAARAHLHAPDEIVRERALMVLGWVGGAKHVAVLSKILTSDEASSVRAMAATQLFFLADGSKSRTERVLSILADVLMREADDRVRDAVVDTAESLTKKRFGAKTDRAARAERARRALAAYAKRASK